MSDGPAPKAPPPSLEFTHAAPPESEAPRGPGRFAPPPPRKLPPWAVWAICFGVVAILLVALVIFVSHHNTNDSNGQKLTPKGVAEENREAQVLEQQDQAPRTFNLTGGPTDLSAVVRAAKVVMEQRINQREAGPPLEAPKCRTTTRSGVQQGYSCVVEAGDVNFDFVAVIDAPAKSLIICKRDPPTPTMQVPLDPSCTPAAAAG